MSSHWVIDYDAVATAAKYVGLAFTTGLGLMGTVTDTKERLPDGNFKVRRIGWIVAVAIIMSSIIGGVGQWFEDRAKKAAEDKQIARLSLISDISARSLARFTGTIKGSVSAALNIDQPLLKEITKRYEESAPISAGPDDAFWDDENSPIEAAYRKELSHIRCTAALSEIGRKPNELMRLAFFRQPAAVDIKIKQIDQSSRIMLVEFQMDSESVFNRRLFSVADFGHRSLSLNCFDAADGPPTAHGGLVERTPGLTFVLKEIKLFDAQMNTELTEAALTPVAVAEGDDEEFMGDTKQLLAVAGRN